MDARGYQQYKEQSINTMTSGELLNLLYDELVKRIVRAELALEKEDYSLFEASIERVIDIVRYLDDTLNHEVPISHELHRLYEFFCYELGRVKIGRNKALLQEIKPMLIELRDSFREAEKSSTAQEQ